MGFSFSGAAPNNGLIFMRLKDYDERRGASTFAERRAGQRARAAVRDPGRDDRGVPAAGDPGAVGVRRLPVRGARPDRRADIAPGRRDARGCSAGATQSGRVVGAFSTFRANDPQLEVNIDRDRARSLGLPLREVTDALQVFARLAVRQRLRLQQPRLSRLRAGRSARSAPSPATSASSTRASQTGELVRARHRRPAHARRRRRRSSTTSTCSDRRRSAATPRRASARARRSPRWSASRARCCRPASTSRGPARRSRK